jgi:hypothetical protein
MLIQLGLIEEDFLIFHALCRLNLSVQKIARTRSAPPRVDTKWRFQFFAKYDYRFLLDVIIAIIATFLAKAIIAISRLSLSISLE